MTIFTLLMLLFVTLQTNFEEAIAADVPLKSTMASPISKAVQDLERELVKCQDQLKSITTKPICKLKIYPQFEKPTEFNGKGYYLSTIKADAIEAGKQCSAIGGYLVEVDDKTEFQFVQKLLASSTYEGIYIAGSDSVTEGTWISQRTGKLIPFFDWIPGEPNNFNGAKEDCIVLWKKDSGRMNDNPCEFKENFLCEV